jgi:putative phage-type endonuclease
VTATLVHSGADEAAWLEARKAGVTASEIAVLMGLSPYGSPFELYHRKIGTLPPEADKAVFERGHVLEPYIAGKFAERHPELGVGGDGRALFAHSERPWQMATPDRIIFDAARISGPDLAVLECKTDAGGDEWGDEGTDDIPVHYRCQVLWQMDVMGVPAAFVGCLLMRQWKIRFYQLTMDSAARADLKVMRSAARRFLERIDHGPAPEVDWRPATTGALRHLHPTVTDTDVPISTQLAGWYLAACRREKAAGERKDLYANRIRALIGDGRRAVDPGRGGAVIATRQVFGQKRISSALVRERYPEVAAECTTTSVISKLVPARAPKESA